MDHTIPFSEIQREDVNSKTIRRYLPPSRNVSSLSRSSRTLAPALKECQLLPVVLEDFSSRPKGILAPPPGPPGNQLLPLRNVSSPPGPQGRQLRPQGMLASLHLVLQDSSFRLQGILAPLPVPQEVLAPAPGTL